MIVEETYEAGNSRHLIDSNRLVLWSLGRHDSCACGTEQKETGDTHLSVRWYRLVFFGKPCVVELGWVGDEQRRDKYAERSLFIWQIGAGLVRKLMRGLHVG